ncbi:ketopantoate reductase PanE/ApbA [Dialister invisus DSM 15470]|uniref:Ketopantoate reductase PanE/ApbA n=1 Tax=Dialister invisus DSM 15470 TaxID=592028 RepID=C9LPY6_9FIRM|nr:ketopantoate reductase PanE/ApbA [Dialister invisus DSM 15470]
MVYRTQEVVVTRILIYGTGVIGSLYAALLSEMEMDVSVYARGNRLKSLQEQGLRYKAGQEVKTAKVTVLSRLEANDRYDYIILAVRENQLYNALAELKYNTSPTIVTMVNSLDTYDKWETICGKGRILPAFPGAGGGFDGDILDAALTPSFIQPTTIGSTDGREKALAKAFKKAGIPCQIVDDMHIWQICYLAMVVPIANAYYESEDPKHAGNDGTLMKITAARIRKNFEDISRMGLKLSPPKMKLFTILPAGLAAVVLGFVFRSSFGDIFMYRHSMKAPDEMRQLHEQFYGYMEKHKA